MEISIYEAKTHLSKIINDLVEEKEEVIYISKNGRPIVQLTLIKSKNTKRVGAAKKELGSYDFSLEDLDSVPVDEFYED